MSIFGITVLLIIASVVAITHGQCIRIRSGNGGNQTPCGQPSCPSCSTTVEDLTTLLAVIRALEERESPKCGLLNVEEIILQLVNALVYATTQQIGIVGGGIGGIGGNGGSGGAGGAGGSGGIGGNGSYGNNPDNNALIALDLLTQDKNLKNIATLFLDGQKVANVGVGSDDGLLSDVLNTVV